MLIRLLLFPPGAFLLCLALPAILCAGFDTPAGIAPQEGPKQVLVLHSYHAGLKWTDDIMEGIREVFSRQPVPPDVYVEYMDSKRNESVEYVDELLDDFLSRKFRGMRFDLLLLSDNNALDFARRHRKGLFEGVPIVFCGINNFHPSLIEGMEPITGVAEIPEIGKTVDIALKLHPDTEEIIFIGRTNIVTGQLNDQMFRAAAQALAGQVKVTFSNDLSLQELKTRTKRVGPGRIVFLGTELKTDTGQVLSFGESARKIREVCNVPLYGFWDFFLGEGIVGGKLVSGITHGRHAAELAVRILSGEDPEAIPVVTSESNPYMFDYRELERFDIPLVDLPKGSIIVHRPPPFLEITKQQLWGALALMGALLIALLVVMMGRWRAEQDLLAAHRQLQDIIEFLPDATFVIDREGRVMAWNRAMEKMSGVPKEEIIGKGDYAYAVPFYGKPRPFLLDVVGSSDPEREGGYSSVKKRGETLLVESEYLPTAYGGKGAYFWATASRLYNREGNFNGAIESIRDITERKKAEEDLKKAIQELDAFVYTVSHDLRTPLTTIVGYADVLRETCRERLNEEELGYLARINASSERMMALMQDLLTLAKVGQVEQPVEPIDSAEVVEEVVKSLVEPLSRAGLKVEIGDLPTLRLPRTLLTQIFDNLIGNAVRYAGKDGGPIEVGGERIGNLVRFHVRDHGPGIEEKERTRIFETFYRGSTCNQAPGTGVGLATVQKIARIYGGRAWVEETKGGGSTFRVEVDDKRS